MALVEVGRFLDFEEAHVAAAALRSSGMFVVVLEGLGALSYGLLYATGGVQVLTNAEDAPAARAFLAEHRVQPSELPPEPPAERGVRALISAAATLIFGIPVLLRRSRRRWNDQPE